MAEAAQNTPPPPATQTSSISAGASAGIDALDGFDNHAEAKAAIEPPAAAATPAPPAAAKAPDAKPEPAKPASTDLDELPTTPKAQEPAAKPVEAAKPAPVAEPKTPKELREAYANRGTELETLRAETAALKAQIESAKKLGAEESGKTFQKQLEEATTAKTELENRLRFLNYRESAEFKSKYEEPIQKAWGDVMEDLKGATYQHDNGQTIALDQGHFQQLLSLPTAEARNLARKLFGDSHGEFMAHRKTIINLKREGDAALDQWKKNGSEMAAQAEAEQKQRVDTVQRQFAEKVENLRSGEMGEIFGRPKDAEAARFFDMGQQLFDRAFHAKGIPDGLTPEQRTDVILKAQAQIAARSAAFGPQRHQLLQTQSKVKELEAELAKYKATAPAPDPAKKTDAAPTKQSWEAALDALPGVG